MGLMKLAMYHRLQGDEVVFFKGKLSNFVLSQVTDEALVKLVKKRTTALIGINITANISIVCQTGKTASDSTFETLLERPFVKGWLNHFYEMYKKNEYYVNPRWDRVCITTLFYIFWDVTIETIEFAKKICKTKKQVLVGGVLASVVPEKVRKATGIKLLKGV